MNEWRLPPAMGAVRWLFITHLLVLVLMLIALGGGWPLAVLAAGVGLNWAWLRRHPGFGMGERAVRGLRNRPAGGWELQVGERWQAAELASGTRLLGRGVLLVLKTESARHTRLVLGGDLEPDALRHLRVAVIEGMSPAS